MNQRQYAPLYMTLALFLLTFLTLFTLNGRVFPNLDLLTAIWVYLALDIALLATLIWGLFSKEKMVRLFSLFANIGLIVPLSIWIFLLLLANGISEA
ncbi:hypothetical protein A6395_05170 [Exiguobacterium sp. SH31]|uniref:hypothetical protein n=1 Tax=unclassified Exiguobacterium TaxID=2644629 RepID=UPI0008CA0250|nr:MULTISPECIES: hypothetical protein [unclassified Exiguobacterium]OGX79733.1 hypothetical protein A6395_05170 [Exiguobacterium sp. SH31]TCI71210.1 hypothetical protein EVJ22_07925 [Exiguobacterium sp. SH0S7]